MNFTYEPDFKVSNLSICVIDINAGNIIHDTI